VFQLDEVVWAADEAPVRATLISGWSQTNGERPTSALFYPVRKQVKPVASDERSELQVLVDRLERSELAGDVGRMVYLALENATDERQLMAAAQLEAARRHRSPKLRIKQLLDTLLPKRPRT
jgi:hypothetical protein